MTMAFKQDDPIPSEGRKLDNISDIPGLINHYVVSKIFRRTFSSSKRRGDFGSPPGTSKAPRLTLKPLVSMMNRFFETLMESRRFPFFKRVTIITMKTLLCLIGLVLVLEGLPYFAFPDKMKKWMRTVQGLSDSHLRVMGFLAMCAGLIIAYLFKK